MEEWALSAGLTSHLLTNNIFIAHSYDCYFPCLCTCLSRLLNFFHLFNVSIIQRKLPYSLFLSHNLFYWFYIHIPIYINKIKSLSYIPTNGYITNIFLYSKKTVSYFIFDFNLLILNTKLKEKDILKKLLIFMLWNLISYYLASSWNSTAML